MLVSVVTCGGIGNVLFQVAAAMAYGERNGDKFVLCDRFNIPSSHGVAGPPISRLEHKDFPSSYLVYREKAFTYEEIPNMNRSVLLSGYFQSAKYFDDFSNIIRERLAPFEQNIPYCSIHIRRGDYLGSDYHNVLDLDYYREAMDIMGHDRYVVVSDDLGWAKANFKNDSKSEILFLDGGSASSVLSILAGCEASIIANSSFSWWGAWFAGGKTIAPRNWFGPTGPSTKDLYQKDWIIV